MRVSVRRAVSWTAIYVVALHTILLGIALPLSAGTTGDADPFSIICHSESSAAGADQSQDSPELVPGHACDHCNLCIATATPAAPDMVLAGNLAPTGLLTILHPISAVPQSGIALSPKLARGPPQQA